ncbi:MAG: hypothetical protein LBF37_02090, partial [Rickettsiales bacterium]|nr:hypothetical protein [Rickettsiales bacterium]
MNSLKRIIFLGSLLATTVFAGANAITAEGVVENANDSSSLGYDGYENITVKSNGSLIVSAATGGAVGVSGTFSIAKDFLHNGNPVQLNDATFHGQGSFAFTGDNASVTAKKLEVGGDFINGDGTGAWNLELNVDTIDVTGTFTIEGNSKLVINPNDYSADPSLTAGDFDIGGGIYMGDSRSDVIHIASDNADNAYTISTTGVLDVDGDIKAEKGKLVIDGGTIQVAGDVLGNVDMDVDGLNIGGLVLDPNTVLNWENRFTNPGTGDLLANGTLNSTGDILVGGSVNGNLDIQSNSDMWIGEDLSGYLGVDVRDLYVLGNVNGSGNINADNVNIGGNLDGGNGGLVIDAGSVNVDG